MYKEFINIAQNSSPIDTYEQEDKGHGRIEIRKVSIYSVMPNDVTALWKNCNRFVIVERQRTLNGETSQETAFYLSDLQSTDAKLFYNTVRGHWGIENRLHYVKDVVQNEDNNKVTSGNAPVTISICGTIAINIHRKNGNQSITYGQIIFGADIPLVLKSIRN